MPFPEPDRSLAIGLLAGDVDAAALLAEAARLRDEGHGRTITYSRKVFIPITIVWLVVEGAAVVANIGPWFD